MDPTPIKIAALQRGHTLKQLAIKAGIAPRRCYRIIEDLAVPTEDELLRIAQATDLPLKRIRQALTPSGSQTSTSSSGGAS